MSLRTCALVALVSLVAVGCGATPKSDEPTTAKEKQRREARANGDEKKSWGGGWRYEGDRNACFYTTGRKCFKNENAACQAAHCKSPKKCNSVGAAPATVSCK